MPPSTPDHRPTWLHALPLALGLALLPSGCRHADAKTSPSSEDAIPVRVAPVERGPFEKRFHATGVVVANAEYTLSFPAGGRLQSVFVEEGAFVRRGQPLAALDPTDAAAKLAQARAAHAKSRRDASRAKALRADDAVPVAAAQDAETGEAFSAATLESASWNLAHTRLAAPEEGFVTRKLTEPGEVVGAGQPIVQLSGVMGGWLVRAAVAEKDLVGLAPGGKAEIRLATRRESIPASIKQLARSANRGTGTFDVELRLDPTHAPAELRAGQTAQVTLARPVDALGAVPTGAVQDADDDRAVVYAVAQGRARRVPVRIALVQGDRVTLGEGIEDVDAVVVDGAFRLFDGARVVLEKGAE